MTSLDPRAALADELEKSVRGYSRSHDGCASLYLKMSDCDLIITALRSLSPYSGASEALKAVHRSGKESARRRESKWGDVVIAGSAWDDVVNALAHTSLPRDAAIVHASDCAVNNTPALPVGPCNCGATELARKSNFPALKVATVRPVSVQETLDIPLPRDAERETNPEVVAAVQQAIMKHPHWKPGLGSSAFAFGLANTAIDAYRAALPSIPSREDPK